MTKIYLGIHILGVYTVRIILVILLAVTLTSCSIATVQSIPVETVIQVQGDPQNKLYVRANNWMVETFRNAESVIQFTDKESGTITGRYLLGVITTPSQYGPGSKAYATINVRVKDGASKITVTPEEFQYAVGNPYTLYTEEKMDIDVANLMASFESYMNTKENDNW